MKKLTLNVISVLLALVLFALPLVGCQRAETPDDPQTESSRNDDVQTEDPESTPQGETAPEAEESGEKEPGASKETASQSGSSAPKVPSDMNLTGFPIAKKPVTLRIMVNTSAAQPDFARVKMFQAYEKMTNVKIEWINIPEGNARTKVMMAFASGDMPDAFLKCGSVLTNSAQYSFAKDGRLFNMNSGNRLKTFAPNFYKFYSENPEVKKAMTFDKGAVYSFPQGVDVIPNKVAGKVFINQEWLKAVNMEMPTTLDELYDVLVAFRDKDPNKNGKKDEIPLSAPNYNYITYMLYGAFGLGNRGVHNPYIDCDEKTGKPRLFVASKEYQEYLQFCNKLYKEKLLDNSIFTMTNSQYIAKQAGNRVGVFCYTNLATIPDEVGNKFAGLDQALKGPHGDQLWYPVRSKLHSSGAFVITSACKHPEIAMRWADFFYSDAGNLLYNYGVEGESHVKQKDGTYKFVPSVYQVIDRGLTFDAAVATHVAIGGSNPIVTKEPFFYGREMDPIPSKAAQNMVPYFPKEIWPNFIFDPKEARDLSTIEPEMKMYIEKMAANFITGREPMSKWDSYVKRLYDMRAQKMLDIYEKAAKRYHS